MAGWVALGGVLVGALQWRLLRTLPVVETAALDRRASRNDVWWLVITPIGWLLAGSTVRINELLPRTPGLVGAMRYVAVVLSGGLLLGVAGAVVVRLTRRSVPRAALRA